LVADLVLFLDELRILDRSEKSVNLMARLGTEKEPIRCGQSQFPIPVCIPFDGCWGRCFWLPFLGKAACVSQPLRDWMISWLPENLGRLCEWPVQIPIHSSETSGWVELLELNPEPGLAPPPRQRSAVSIAM
jgi:hypothetical protein